MDSLRNLMSDWHLAEAVKNAIARTITASSQLRPNFCMNEEVYVTVRDTRIYRDGSAKARAKCSLFLDDDIRIVLAAADREKHLQV